MSTMYFYSSMETSRYLKRVIPTDSDTDIALLPAKVFYVHTKKIRSLIFVCYIIASKVIYGDHPSMVKLSNKI